jgi:hypothetical protein
VLEIVSKMPELLNYLPDDPEAHVTRDYLFAVVNTLDCSFFERVEKELEEKFI